MRIIGMDIHRVAAEVVSLLDGKIVKLGRVQMLRNKLEAFAKKELTHDDHVVIEATGNAAAVAEVLSPYVDRVVIANPKQVHMIAHAKVKTDTIDATVLAKLYASGFLPEVWVPDPGTLALRRQVTRRTQLVRQRSRLKNLIQSILHAHLIPPCPHGNLVGISGRKWLTRQILPADECAAIERHLGLINQINEALTVVEADIAVHAAAARLQFLNSTRWRSDRKRWVLISGFGRGLGQQYSRRRVPYYKRTRCASSRKDECPAMGIINLSDAFG